MAGPAGSGISTREECNRLLGRDQSGLAGDTLPSLIAFDPGVGEAFAVYVRFTLFNPFDAENSHDHGSVSVHLNFDLFIDCLRRLVFRRLDAGEKLAFGRETTVDFDSGEGIREEHIEGLGILGFDRVIPSVFQAQHASSFVTGRVLRGAGDGCEDEERRS